MKISFLFLAGPLPNLRIADNDATSSARSLSSMHRATLRRDSPSRLLFNARTSFLARHGLLLTSSAFTVIRQSSLQSFLEVSG